MELVGREFRRRPLEAILPPTIGKPQRFAEPSNRCLIKVSRIDAEELFKKTPETARPDANKQTISGILRTLYLVEKDETGAPRPYLAYFKQISEKKTNSELKLFIKERAIAFAKPWFAKKAVEARGKWATGLKYMTTDKKTVVRKGIKEFDTHHKWNEQNADENDKLDAAVDEFIKLLKRQMP